MSTTVTARQRAAAVLVALGLLTVVIALFIGLRHDNGAERDALIKDGRSEITCVREGRYACDVDTAVQAAKEAEAARMVTGLAIAGIGALAAAAGAVVLLSPSGRR